MRQFQDFYIPQPYVDYLPVGEGIKEYILLKDYVIKWRRGDVLFRITVPKGFNTDFGTTPGGIFNEPNMIAGYVAHDWLYYQNTNDVTDHADWYQYYNPQDPAHWATAIADWDRKSSDSMMLALHKEAGAPWWKRSLVYRTVRIAGKPYWES